MKLLKISLSSVVLISALSFSADLLVAQTPPPPAQPAAKPTAQPAPPAPDALAKQKDNIGDNKKADEKKGEAKGKGKGNGGKGGVACKGDRELYCKGIANFKDRRACLIKNHEVLSPTCKVFIDKVIASGTGGTLPNPTPGPVPKKLDNKIEVNSAAVPAKPATTLPPVAKPAPAPEKKK